MRKTRKALAFIGVATFLFSCAKELSRAEAADLLDKIVFEVKSKDFETPNSCRVTYNEFDNVELKETSIDFSFANTSKNHYLRRKITTKAYEEDPKANAKAACTIKTEDEYYYIDNLASPMTFISYVKVTNEKYPEENAANSVNEPKVTFSQAEGESAMEEWTSRINDPSYECDMFTKDIVDKPYDLRQYLRSLSSDQYTLIKESEFNSTGDGNLDVYIVTDNINGDNEESRMFKFDGYLIRMYKTTTNKKTVSVSYSWNNFKPVYPEELNKASSETSESSLN